MKCPSHIDTEGQPFLEATQPSLIALQRALQSVRNTKKEVAGPLRIMAPRTVVQPVLGPVLDEYCLLHPEVVPDMQLDDRIGNWVEDRIDVGSQLCKMWLARTMVLQTLSGKKN